jgi:hypothetical protein
MPVNLDDSGLVLLDVLGHPPVIVLLKVANTHTFGSRSHSKLVLFGTPFHVSSSSVDTKNYKYWLPFVAIQRPYVGITIVRARHDSVGLGSPVNSSYNLVVLGESGLEYVVVSLSGIDVDLIVVWAKSNLGSIGVPGVASYTRG